MAVPSPRSLGPSCRPPSASLWAVSSTPPASSKHWKPHQLPSLICRSMIDIILGGEINGHWTSGVKGYHNRAGRAEERRKGWALVVASGALRLAEARKRPCENIGQRRRFRLFASCRGILGMLNLSKVSVPRPYLQIKKTSVGPENASGQNCQQAF